MWFDIESSLQTNDSKWLDSSCDSTLTRLDQVMTLTRLEKFLDDSDSTLTREACDSDSTLTREACDSDSTLTRQKWHGHITAFWESIVAHILTHSVNLAFGPKSDSKYTCGARAGFWLVISGLGFKMGPVYNSVLLCKTCLHAVYLRTMA